jgi:tetratricopeptide (TPR) repeat protein
MAKNKKSPADEPDEFVQSVVTIGDRLRPHAKKIAVGVGLILAAVAAWQVMVWMKNRKARAATTDYVAAMKVVEAPVVNEDNPLPPGYPEPEVKFESREAWRTAAVEAIEKLESEHADMPLSGLPALRIAKIKLESGQFDEAKQAFESFAKSDAPEAMRLSALEGVGYALEAKALANEDASARQAGLEAALQAFARIQPNEKGLMRDYCLYHQGRMQVALGKVDEGLATYRKLLAELPDSSLVPDVENRIATLSSGSKE